MQRVIELIGLSFAVAMATQSGPYKTTLTRVEPCSRPTPPIDKNPPATFYAELYNTTVDTNLMRGNITVLKDHIIKKISARSHIKIKNKWKVNLILDFGCYSIVFPIMATATGLPYDPKTCGVFKGEYRFSNFNHNKLQHLVMRTQEYGATLWKVEVFSAAGSAVCYDFETLIEPI